MKLLTKYELNKEDALFLVIDIQEKLANVMDQKKQILANTKILIEAGKVLDIPIIFTEQYPKGIGSTLEELKENLDNPEIHEKNSFNAYLDDIKKAIDGKKRKKIIVTGMETHICVMQTSRALIAGGYEVFIARDAVGSRSQDNYLNGLDQMKAMGASITNTEAIIFDLLKISGTPEFKVLSKMIK